MKLKLIRLTDDRYVLDVGPGVRPDQMEEIRNFWQDWWSKNIEMPEVVVFGGLKVPLEYEDRRDSDLENRVAELERLAHVHEVTP